MTAIKPVNLCINMYKYLYKYSIIQKYSFLTLEFCNCHYCSIIFSKVVYLRNILLFFFFFSFKRQGRLFLYSFLKLELNFYILEASTNPTRSSLKMINLSSTEVILYQNFYYTSIDLSGNKWNVWRCLEIRRCFDQRLSIWVININIDIYRALDSRSQDLQSYFQRNKADGAISQKTPVKGC